MPGGMNSEVRTSDSLAVVGYYSLTQTNRERKFPGSIGIDPVNKIDKPDRAAGTQPFVYKHGRGGSRERDLSFSDN
jgi:hypothetical protein